MVAVAEAGCASDELRAGELESVVDHDADTFNVLLLVAVVVVVVLLVVVDVLVVVMVIAAAAVSGATRCACHGTRAAAGASSSPLATSVATLREATRETTCATDARRRTPTSVAPALVGNCTNGAHASATRLGSLALSSGSNTGATTSTSVLLSLR